MYSHARTHKSILTYGHNFSLKNTFSQLDFYVERNPTDVGIQCIPERSEHEVNTERSGTEHFVHGCKLSQTYHVVDKSFMHTTL